MSRYSDTFFAALALLAYILPTVALATALTDPTRPNMTDWYGHRPARPAGDYVLNSTLVSAERRVAIINDKQVAEGETIGDAIVISIRKHAVVLQSSKRQITLELLPDIESGQTRTVDSQP